MLVINKKVSFGTAVFSAVSLKLCCWGPLLLTGVAGISGSTIYFSWLESLKPYLLSLAFISLAYSFYQIYNPNNQVSCNYCDTNQQSRTRSKIYLWFVAVIVVGMTLVSYHPKLFYRSDKEFDISVNT